MKASTLWRRQHLGSPLRLPMANDERYGSLTDAKTPISQYRRCRPHCRCKTSVYLFLSHISISKRFDFFFFFFWYYHSFLVFHAQGLVVFLFLFMINGLVVLFFFFFLIGG